MPISLHGATVEIFEQELGALAGLLDKASTLESDVVGARLAPDMLPFGYQVKSAAAHSIGAIEGVRAGTFSPDRSAWPDSLAGLADTIAAARASLATVTPEELENLIGRDARFVMGETDIPFTAENFLLSFSLPNFFFHVTTSYAILRMLGLGIGKRDFLGKLRIKR